MTAKPNLWVVLSESYGWMVYVSSEKEAAERFAKDTCYWTEVVEYAPVEKRENATERAARLGFNLESATGENIDVITGKRFDDE